MVIFAATLAAYAPALRAGFVWNDSDYVTAPALRSLAGLKRIWCEVGATEQYYPVLHSAFWIEHRLWGDTPLGYHLLNILLHATCAVLLGVVFRELLDSRTNRRPVATTESATESSRPYTTHGAEWLAALLFALHPVCVESVAWISEQKNTLSTLFYLLAALAYMRFENNRSWQAYVVGLGCFALALLSKSVTATLPGALLLCAWHRQRRCSWRRDALALLPWFALGAGAGLFTAWVERSIVGAHGAGYELSMLQRCFVAGRALWFYLGKLAWPSPLIFIYPRWAIPIGAAIGWGALALAAGVTGVLWRRARTIFCVWAFFCLSLFPVLGFLNIYAFRYSFVADHWEYLPAMGVLAAVAVPLARKPLVAVILILSFGVLTWRQSNMYHDSERLYRTTLERNPSCWMASQNLASLLLESDRVEEAVVQFQQTLQIDPQLADAENNLAIALERLGRKEEAIAHLRRALVLKPDYGQADYNLGQMLLDLNRAAEAIEPLDAAARLNPGAPEIHDRLGVAYAAAGRWEDAIRPLESAIHLRSDYADPHFRLALVFWHLGRREEAVAQRKEALRLDPSLPP